MQASKDLSKQAIYLAALLSLGLFIAACSLPQALVLRNNHGALSDMAGLDIILTGWLGIFVTQFAWYANCFYLCNLILLFTRKFKEGIGVGLVGCGLGLTTFTWLVQKICMNEGGVGYSQLDHPGPGFYLWMGSMLLLPLACFYLMRSEKVVAKATSEN